NSGTITTSGSGAAIDFSASDQANSATLVAGSTTYGGGDAVLGGSGADTVTIQAGAILGSTTNANGATNANATIDGGSGANVLDLVDGTGSGALNLAYVTNFPTLNKSGTGT